MIKYISLFVFLSLAFSSHQLFAKKNKKTTSDCSTNAGAMNQTAQFRCDGDTVSSISLGFNLDENDTLVYYLHEGNSKKLINPIDSNFTGIFNNLNVKFNKQYYISAVAADTLINWINLKDTCLNVSVGTPVKWIKVIAGKDFNSTCRDYFPLNAIVFDTSSTIKWTTNDNLSLKFKLSNSSFSTEKIDTAIINFQNKTVKIYLEETNNCFSKDTIEVFFSDSVLVDFSVRDAKCYHNQSKDTSSNFLFKVFPTNFNNYTWNFDGATIIKDYGKVNADTICNVYWKNNETHLVTLFSNNCPYDTIKKTVKEPENLYVKFDVVPATCHQNNGKIIAHPMFGNSPYYQYDTLYWQPDPQISKPLDTIQKNLFATKYRMNIKNEFCTSINYVTVKDSGLVKAELLPDVNSGIAELLKVNFANISTIDGVSKDTIPVSAEWIINKKMFVNGSDTTFLDTIVKSEYLDSISYTYFDGGKFKVQLIVTSYEGCKDTSVYKYIDVDIESIMEGEEEGKGLPNYLTPNGDGIHDSFKIKVRSLETFSGVIFNRWGRIVYEWNNTKDDGWDGTNNGEECPSGVYYYVIKGTGKDGTVFKNIDSPDAKKESRASKKETLTGFITLIRNKNDVVKE
jgi:gliding motility-associated-like protein